MTWPDPFNIQTNDDGELIFECGDFQILLDKHAHIQISGGSRGDRLIIQKFHGDDAVTDEVQLRPIVIAEGEEIKCHFFFVERINTFINKGSMDADAVILRSVKNVENHGTFRSRNFILAGSSLLTNKGMIYWSDFYDLSGDAKVVEDGGTVTEGKKTKLSFKITPKVREYFERGYGIYLDFSEICGQWLLPFDDLKNRSITLYLAGDCCYYGEEAPLISFTRDVVSKKEAQEIIDTNKHNVYRSSVSRIGFHDNMEKKKEFCVSFESRSRLTPVRFEPGGVLYVFLD